MQRYNYIGKKRGRRATGKVNAKSESEARLKLRFDGIQIQEIWTGTVRPSQRGKSVNLGSLLGRKVKDTEIVVFTRQMSTMIDSGISLVAGLELLAEQTMNPEFRKVIDGVRHMVEGGMELHQALERHPRVFDQTYIALVRAGTSSGQLDEMMKRLSSYIEKASRLKKQTLSAMMYPGFVLTFALGMTAFMLLVVVPMLAKNYVESGTELPGLTQGVIDISNFLARNFHYIMFGIILGGFIFAKWKATPEGRRKWERTLLKIPIFGKVISKVSMARFTSTMSTLIAAGLNMTDCLQISGQAAGNANVQDSVKNIENDVVGGRSLAQAIQRSPLFPAMVGSMIAIGEQTGKLQTMLEKVASIYEEDVDVTLAASLKMIEPIMFVVIGAIVGTILIAMYLPVFDMGKTIGM